MRSRLGKASATALAALLVAIAVGGSPVAPAAEAARAVRIHDPTWAEVKAAQKSVAAKAAEVTTLQKALDRLEADAARLGTVAVQKAAAATAATSRLRAAQDVYDRLHQQTVAAGDRAADARRTAAAVTSQLYRAGDPTIAVWLSGAGSDSLLYRLGALDQIGTSSSDLMQQARVEQRQAAAIGAEAKTQATVRDSLAKVARTAADTAKDAERAADEQVSATKGRRATLQAQLASLKAKSNSLAASYAADQAARRAAAAAGAGGGGSGSLGGLSGGPDSLAASNAQAYAASRLGAYGWSSSQMGCLTRLWNIESGWRWNAYNASSGAYGIPQALPGSKMAAAGGDWTTSARTQIEWGLGYIQARYSTPCGAVAFETSHVPYWY